MSSTENKYKLNQDDKEYILSASEENQSFKISCQDSTNQNSLNYQKYFTLDELKNYNIFTSITSIKEALEQFDKLLNSEKVAILETNKELIINLYTSNSDKIEFVLSPETKIVNEENNVQLKSDPSEQVFSSHVEPQYAYAQNQNLQNIPQNYQGVPDIQQPIFTMADQNQNQNINQTNYNQQFVKNEQMLLNPGEFFTHNTISGIVDAQTYCKFIEWFTNGQVIVNPYEVSPQSNFTRTVTQTTSYQYPNIIEKNVQMQNINYDLPNDIRTQVDNYNTYVNQINKSQPSQQQYQTEYKSKEVITTENKFSNIDQQNELKALKEENEYMKSQLAELDSLKKRIAELENFKDQLSELESLRQTVNELNDLKNNILHTKKEVIEQQEIIRRPNEENKLIFENTIHQISIRGDIIRNSAELEMLSRKMNKNTNKICLNLIYKATADSDKAQAFHEKCDGARSTLVLIETTQGRRFGGFTTCSWGGDCIDKKDDDAFIFSLDKMMIYDNIPGEDAVGCYPKFGAIFLGCQIRIYDDAFTKGGTTFEKGLNYNTQEDFELNGGERVFGIKEIEVYEVIPQ